ncbi:hypothetical protein AAHB37_02090 [Glutamicibacter halophytocola]|uniref:hypothetical protein n=1 Tax=Glutamicibacter halophytocola TaxID=1933880 RepID=UPI00321AB98B
MTFFSPRPRCVPRPTGPWVHGWQHSKPGGRDSQLASCIRAVLPEGGVVLDG